MNVFIKLTSVAIAILVGGCSFPADSNLRNVCSPWVSTFYQKPVKEQVTAFDSYSLDDQYQIFICGNQMMHPPAIYLAEPFARRGINAVPLLKEKLVQSNDDLTIRDIVLVFSEMKRINTYDVSKDADLAALINAKVGGMRNAGWREITQENVKKYFGPLWSKQ